MSKAYTVCYYGKINDFGWTRDWFPHNPLVVFDSKEKAELELVNIINSRKANAKLNNEIYVKQNKNQSFQKNI